MSANVDDKFRGQFTAALTAENTTEVEEAYVETLSLGSGFTARGGRFLSGVGYLNSVHAHAWDFADQPLVYRAMLGNQYKDDGVQLRWVAPTDLFMELGAEVLRGGNFPAGGAARNGKGTNTAFMRIGGDVGTDHSWRAGISRLKAESASRATTNGSATDLYTGTSDLTGVDFVWKWAPDGNPGSGTSSSRRNTSRATRTARSTRLRRGHRSATAANRRAGTPRGYTSSGRAGARGCASTSSGPTPWMPHSRARCSTTRGTTRSARA